MARSVKLQGCQHQFGLRLVVVVMGVNQWGFSQGTGAPPLGCQAPCVAEPIMGSPSGGLTHQGGSTTTTKQWTLKTQVG
jgi:hypothetical protein